MLVSRDIINGLTPVAEGYKIFNNNWTAEQDGYDYKDPDTGKAVGSVHQAAGTIICCRNGFHFCENPLDCLSRYPMVQWNKFAKVRGYGAIARHDGDSKIAAEILEITAELTWDEFLEAIKQQANIPTDADNGINGGCDIYGGHHIYGGYDIYGGYNIYGGERCYGVSNIYFCRSCQGCVNCLCCFEYTGKNAVFNQPVTEERFNTIKSAIHRLRDGWFPKFTNAYELYAANGQDWSSTPAPKITGTDRTYAYADMPQELVDYIKSLPEFDADIWYEITGRKEE